MGGKRVVAALGMFVGAGLLPGCCLFRGNPEVTITGPSTATTGTAVTFTANVTGVARLTHTSGASAVPGPR